MSKKNTPSKETGRSKPSLETSKNTKSGKGAPVPPPPPTTDQKNDGKK